MARFLAVDWDGVEARFALGAALKDRLVLFKVGATSIPTEENERAPEKLDETEPTEADETGGDEDDDDADVVETVEKEYVPRLPVADDEEEDDEEADVTVVSTVKKKGESFKTSPLARAIKSMLREKRVGKATILCAVERGLVEVIPMSIPNASEAETPELVLNQTLRESLSFNETQPLDFCQLGLPDVAKRSGFRRVAAVSIARDKLRRVRETLVGAHGAPKKLELREPALVEFLRADYVGFKSDEPIMLVQVLCDEINLALAYQGNALFFRSAKFNPDLGVEALAAQIRREIFSTTAVGLDDLPEDAVLRRVALFTDETPSQVDADVDSSELEPTLASALGKALKDDEIKLDLVNPFQLSGIQLKTPEPLSAGRYASLIGMILAERPQSRPAIDLLHPREKPKPPNFTLLFIAYFFFVALAAFFGWKHCKADLARLDEEREKVEKEWQVASGEYNAASIPYNVLTNANNWTNGPVVLDEFRDVLYRLPEAPDFVATRLAYVANWRGSQRRPYTGAPVFIISAKITSLETYQLFRSRMTYGNCHGVYVNGPYPNQGGGGYKYMFDATITCSPARRSAQSFLNVLPRDIQEISPGKPEYFAQKEEEERRALEEEKDKQTKKFNEIVESVASELEKGAEGVALDDDDKSTDDATPTDDEYRRDAKYAQLLVRRRAETTQALAALQQFASRGLFSNEEIAEFQTRASTTVAAIEKSWNETRRRMVAKEKSFAQSKRVSAINATLDQYAAVLANGPAKLEESIKALASNGATNENSAPDGAPSEASASPENAPEGESSDAATPEPAEPTADQLRAYLLFLEKTLRPRLRQGYQSVATEARNGAFDQETVATFDKRFRDADQAIVESYQANKTRLLNETTLEDDLALKQNLETSRRQIDAEAQRVFAQGRQGQIPQEKLAQFQTQYNAEVAAIVAKWQAVSQLIEERQMMQTGENQTESAADASAPAPEAPAETPAPAPEAPAETSAPAPEAPAETPAPAPEAPAETPAPAPEAPAETSAPAPEAPAETPAPAPEAPAETPAPAPEAPAETPAPAPEAPAETPAPAPEAPAETPAPAPEAPAETPAPAPEAPAETPAQEQPASQARFFPSPLTTSCTEVYHA